MRAALTFLLAISTLSCVAPHKPCVTELQLGVYGSESEGTSRGSANRQGQRDTWDNDDTTVGGSATLIIDLTGSCEGE